MNMNLILIILNDFLSFICYLIIFSYSSRKHIAVRLEEENGSKRLILKNSVFFLVEGE